MKTIYITALVLTLSAASCSAMLEFKDYDNNAVCGNGVVDEGAPDEECDEGPDNSDAADGACRTDCTNARCGDGWTDTESLGEICDSGADNGQPGRCNSDCSGQVPDVNCGNGVVEGDEQCDDGNNVDGDGCSADCKEEVPVCGNGVWEADEGEQCDGADLGDAGTCIDQGFGSGTVICDGECNYDVSDCGDFEGCVPVQDLTCTSGTIVGDTMDAGATNGMVSYCGNSGTAYTGREMVYRFVSSTTQRISVDLGVVAGDLDLFVLPDSGTFCEDQQCFGASTGHSSGAENVSFMAMAGQGYFIVIDGFQGDTGPFELAVRCLVPEDCSNGADDNADGLTDCWDPDCAGTAWCTGAGEVEQNCNDMLDNDSNGFIDCLDPVCQSGGMCQCPQAATLSCNVPVMSDNYDTGSTNQVIGGWCGGVVPNTGGERVFELDLSTVLGSTTALTFTIDQLTADLDMYIMETFNVGCGVTLCGPNQPVLQSGTAPESATTPLNSSARYFLVVDGWQWAKGEFRATIGCN